MEDLIIFVVFFGYMIWGIYCGYRFLSGRSKWLDEQRPINRVVKFILSLMLGTFLGAVYIADLICKIGKLFFG